MSEPYSQKWRDAKRRNDERADRRANGPVRDTAPTPTPQDVAHRAAFDAMARGESPFKQEEETF